MAAWLTFGTLLGLALTVCFTVLAFRSLPGAVYAFALAGAIPWVHVGAFAGNEIVQSLLLAEVLATALLGVWVFRRGSRVLAASTAVPFNKWLLLLLPLSLLSLASGFSWIDHTVPQRNVKVLVSVGQILLFFWPIAIYLVAADQVRSIDWIRRFRRTVMLLAVPQVVTILSPGTTSYLSWSVTFGLIAAPLACAAFAYEHSVLRRGALAGLVALPMLQGLKAGKAFLYTYVTVSILVVLWVRGRRAFVVTVMIVVMAVIGVQFVPGSRVIFAPFQWLIDVERSQQSWGGRAGRLALAVDATKVWSGYPVLGVGPGNSYPYMLRYSVIGTPHSQYTNLLVELGSVGTALFIAFVAGVLRFGGRAVRVPRDQEAQVFLLGWFASFVAWSISSLGGDYMLHSIRNGGLEMFSGFYIHWVFLGAAVGIARAGIDAVPSGCRLPAGPRTWVESVAGGRPWSWA